MSIEPYYKNGKLHYKAVKYVGRNKRITKRGFTNKTSARAWEADTTSAINKGDTICSKSTTLGEYLELWYSKDLNGAKRTVTPYTYQRYRQHINNIIGELGHIKLNKLSIYHVFDAREVFKKRLAPLSIKHMESVLKSALRDGIGHHFTHSPLRQLKTIQIEDKEEKDIKFFEPWEQQKLLQTAKDYSYGLRTRNFTEKRPVDLRWYMRAYIARNTGLRSGEISALMWHHVDFEKEIIKVRKSVEYSSGDTQGNTKSPKTKKGTRDVHLKPSDIAELKKYKAWVGQKLLALGLSIKDTPVIFAHDGGYLHRSQVRKIWDTIVKQSGLEHRGIHCLRHSHASNLIAQNVNIKIISERLGHKSTSITWDRYGHLYPENYKEQITDALEKIDRMG